MTAKEHPNDAPGVPMVFPPWLESLGIKFFNPAIRPLARYLPMFAMIEHRGRTSGKSYDTVVSAYRKGDLLAILLPHGKTNWAKNVLAAGEADVHLFRHDVHITNPRVLPAGTSGDELPRIVQRPARRIGVFVADIT
jgi:deazaflavin-dependent oxidoreductase (nitroreductase family)